jgi:branched-chain amino acid aminotransferase
MTETSMRESLFASGNRIPFLKPWLETMRLRFESVGWHLPDEFQYTEFRARLEKLLNKNRLFKGSRIHLMITPVFPSTELDCSPSFSCIGITEELEYDYFPLNAKGLTIGVSERHHNTADAYVSSMVRSPLRNLMVRQEAAFCGCDEIILTDQQGCISETLGSNIFIKTGDQVFTPSAANHGFPRMLSGLTSSLLPKAGFRAVVSSTLKREDLVTADEVFLTDDYHGLRWVLGYENKRYYRKLSGILHEELTELIRTTDQFQAGSSG